MKNTKNNFNMICGNIIKFFNYYDSNILYWENNKNKAFNKGKIKCKEKYKGDMLVFFSEIDEHLCLEIVDVERHKHWWIVNEASFDWGGVTEVIFKGNRIVIKENHNNKLNYTCFQKE